MRTDEHHQETRFCISSGCLEGVGSSDDGVTDLA